VAPDGSAIVFDVGGVLFRPNLKWLRELGHELSFTEDQVQSFFVGRTSLETAMAAGPFRTKDMLPRAVERLTPLFGPRARWAASRILALYSDPEAMRLDEEVVGMLRQLRAAGHLVGILSNGPADSHQLRWFIENEPVDAVVNSGRDGVAKPSDEAFDLILNRLGVTAAETWFVDDSPNHIAAASEYGLRAVLFTGDVAALMQDLRAGGVDW
jgi:HAD superfamily hydrolase (TIGR01509 family)